MPAEDAAKMGGTLMEFKTPQKFDVVAVVQSRMDGSGPFYLPSEYDGDLEASAAGTVFRYVGMDFEVVRIEECLNGKAFSIVTKREHDVWPLCSFYVRVPVTELNRLIRDEMKAREPRG